jgi:hypothetical protein
MVLADPEVGVREMGELHAGRMIDGNAKRKR